MADWRRHRQAQSAWKWGLQPRRRAAVEKALASGELRRLEPEGVSATPPAKILRGAPKHVTVPVRRSHDWRPAVAEGRKLITVCSACPARVVYMTKEDGAMVKLSGPSSSICAPRTEKAKQEMAKPRLSEPGSRCTKCGSWMNRKFRTCSNRECPDGRSEAGATAGWRR